MTLADRAFSTLRALSDEIENWLSESRLKAFYVNAAHKTSLRRGLQSLLRSTGVGKVRPNVFMLGFRRGWQQNSLDAINDYVGILRWKTDRS